tara:strand:+ start:1062 stop:1238 length:177 start_codon:yes stop_codon:yes gene_type:complete
MSKESASTLAALQKRLTEAEDILKLILEHDVDSDIVKQLTTTYFSYIKSIRSNNEKKI